MERNNRRTTLEGIVVSDKRDKTITVKVVRQIRHPKYEKLIDIWKNYHVHDESNQVKEGQKVLISFTRPLSKTKRWRVSEVLK
jgi:small subunit ribosomal protein S17